MDNTSTARLIKAVNAVVVVVMTADEGGDGAGEPRHQSTHVTTSSVKRKDARAS